MDSSLTPEELKQRRREYQRKYMRQLRDAARMPLDLDSTPERMTPLEYMLSVMRDPRVDPRRRARMAIEAAPYIHPKVTKTAAEKLGVKEARQRAAEEAAANGEFATSAPPTHLKLIASGVQSGDDDDSDKR